MARRILHRTALLALWLLFVLALLELAGFFYFHLEVSKPAGGYAYPSAMFVAKPGVEYGLRPGFQGKFDGVAFCDIPIEINAAGYRDVAFAPKRSDALRVAVLGDSVVFGAGVAAQERFTDLLRGFTLAGDRAVELLNLGVNSYTFGHYLTQAEQGFDGLEPDAVLIGFTLNDCEELDSSWPRQLVLSDTPPGPEAPLKYRIRRALGSSYAGRFLRDLRDKLVLATMKLDEREAYHTKWMRRSNERWRDPAVQQATRTRLRRMQALLETRHLPVLVLVFPEFNDVRRPEAFDFARRTVLGMLAELRLPVCDPYPAFARAPDPAVLFLANDSVHYTPAGHRIIADQLAACLRESAWGRR